MSKILGLDFGNKRVGVAITDSLRIIASPLTTVETKNIVTYLKKLFEKEKIEIIVIGEARYLNGQQSATTLAQAEFAAKISSTFSDKLVVRVDETYTSKMAAQSLVLSGMRKSERQKKENLDMVSAAIILQSYLDSPKK